MNTPEIGSKWELPTYGTVQVIACNPRGRPPGRQVKFATLSEESDVSTLGLKFFLKAAKPL